VPLFGEQKLAYQEDRNPRPKDDSRAACRLSRSDFDISSAGIRTARPFKPGDSEMTIGTFARLVTLSTVGAVALIGGTPSIASAQGDHMHASTAQKQELRPEQRAKIGALLKAVREATERFQDSAAAENEGYQLQFGCVSGSDAGAMGVHFVNGPLVMDGELDVAHPEIVLYEPLSNGRLRITGADYLVLASAWDAKHAGPPQLMGQLFHLFDSPNRFGLPPFYTLHVWAWKENPAGAFTNWNPAVSCEAFTGQDR
jgi:hypothetical protein